MGEGVIGVDEPDAADKYIHTWSRDIGGTIKEGQFVLPGEPVALSYSAVGTNISTTTSASHIAMLQGDGTLYTRVHRIYVEQASTFAGADSRLSLQVVRTTTAGTGGGAITARPYDGADADYAGSVMSLPSSKGTEDDILLQGRLTLLDTQPTTSAVMDRWEWRHDPHMKPIIIAPAVTNGIVIKVVTGIASLTVDWTIEFSTTSYL